MQLMDLPGRSSRRVFLAGAAGFVLAGCAPGRADDPASSGGFSVTLEGKFGPTVLDRLPRRVITLGFGQDIDAAVALGVIPVATQLGTSTADGIQPWVGPLLGAGPPEPIRAGPDRPLERLAALRPDLILAVGDYYLETGHRQLAEIAPVLAYVTGPNLDPWQESTRRIGRALGKDAQAERLIDDTMAKIASARDAAALEGKTFTFSSVGGAGQVYTKNSAADVLAVSLAQFGLRLSEKVTGLPSTATKGIAAVGPERLDLLDADIVLITYESVQQRQAFESEPLFARIPAVRRGSYLALDRPEAQALAFPSALAIGYTAERIVPRLAATAR
ncbi:iron-siderophore ABC transporter substrate-binding protein [Amycolatopsis speibonae]|uniref:Iron-siderophore ABC transporter substrate-binding protein n=1 Tax=Amycolatopsis speibonae TaxID=1450224 RepID=A0ABV7P7I4_9PSEU